MAKPPRMTMPKPKPMPKPAAKAPDMSTAAVLRRAERVQREEAGESMMMKRKPVEVIRTTVSFRPTPAKKK